MKRILFLIALTAAGAANAATLAPEPRELLKSIDAVLGEVPPEPATQTAISSQKSKTCDKSKPCGEKYVLSGTCDDGQAVPDVPCR